jgi:hypothetical protein
MSTAVLVNNGNLHQEEKSPSEAISKTADSIAHSVNTAFGFDVSPDARNWFNFVIDPFGQGTGVTPKKRVARIPDGKGGETILIVLTGRLNYTVNAATLGHMFLVVPQAHDGYSAMILYTAGTATDPLNNTGLAPTAYTPYAALEGVLASGFLDHHEYRVVGSAARAVCVSPMTTATGFFTPVWVNKYPIYGSTTYKTWQEIRNRTSPNSYSMAQGCTVRIRVTDDTLDFSTQEGFAAYTASTDPHYELPGGECCGIAASGLVAGQQVMYQWVVGIEVKMTEDYSPIPVSQVVPDINIMRLVHAANDFQQDTSAHSFSSVFKGLWGGIKKVGSAVVNKALPIANVVSDFVPGGSAIKRGLQMANKIVPAFGSRRQKNGTNGGGRAKQKTPQRGRRRQAK